MIYDRLLSSVDGGEILDVGCGKGQFTGILTGSLRSFQSLTGVDVDAAALEEARRTHPGPAFRFLQVSGKKLPFGPASFDMVAISKALHHVEDPEFTLREMKRVLRKGGHFLINEMHRDQLSEAEESHMLYHHLRSDLDRLLGISHHHTFTRSELLRLADELDLADRVIMEFRPDPGDPADPDRKREFQRKLDEWLGELEKPVKQKGPAEMKDLAELKLLAEMKEIESRIRNLRGRISEVGITRAPQLLILGKK